MSESDATTDPADLIKTAAAFGHTACAVTDHGVVQAFPHVFEAAKKINKKRGDDEPKSRRFSGAKVTL